MFKSLNLIIIGLLIRQLSAHDIPVLRGAKSLSDVKAISNGPSRPNPEIDKILDLVSNNLPDASVEDDIRAYKSMEESESDVIDRLYHLTSIVNKTKSVIGQKLLSLVVDIETAALAKDNKFPNEELFAVLRQLGKDTKVEHIVDIQKNITFSNDLPVRPEYMWYMVKSPGGLDEVGIGDYLYGELLATPPVVIDETILMTNDDYDSLIGGHILTGENMMVVESPLECFLENSPAFCAPDPDDVTVSVCDLDYLNKYEVTEETPSRYGGVAKIKDGAIYEISGVRKDDHDPEFHFKLNVFLSSFAVHVVMVKHALIGHLAIYQKYNMRLTVNREAAYQALWSQGNGSPELLMKALTPEAANTVNYKIKLLLGPNGSLVGRAMSLTNASFVDLNRDIYDEWFAYEPDEVVNKLASSGSEGWKRACLNAWTAARETVDVICRDIKGDAALKNTDLEDLSMLLWAGTFYHGMVGDFQLDNLMRGNLPFPLTGKDHIQSKGYGMISTSIGVATTTRTMNMATLGSYFNTVEDRDQWKSYQKVLAESARLIGIEGFTYDGAVYNAIDF